MVAILRRLPFFDDPTLIRVRGIPVRIKAHQIVVWVSPERTGRNILPASAGRFPAILDTGHSHNFSISEELLESLTGFNPQMLPRVGRVRIHGSHVPLLAANVWVHRNRAGQRDLLLEQSAFCIELDTGIAVYPRDAPAAPRLPLLGLRALRRAKLRPNIDCQRCRVSLKPPRRFWFFG